MAATVEIDKAGRIVVPKKLRDSLHLTPGTRLHVQQRGSSILLEPEFAPARLEIRDGWPVILPADLENAPIRDQQFFDDILEQTRLERERRILGLDEGE